MTKIFAVLALTLISLSAVTADVSAHSGRTDKNGCHNDNKNGTRHCH
ncbi:YHYH domain-containing protein [Paenalcaligenes niemegkensis]